MYETNVELAVSSQAVNQVKAHYAAKAGVEISLLRLHIFRKAAAMTDGMIPSSMLDMIWQTPFMWPPVVPDGASSVDKDEIKAAVKTSSMQGQYLSTIEAESGKIDLNDLGSPLKGVVENTRRQLIQLFAAKQESDEEFARRHRGTDFNELVTNIKDWVDEDNVSDDGSPENMKYASLGAGDQFPPNQAFKTMQELHMVAGMTDEFFDLLASRVTIFGSKGINVNYAPKDVLKSLDPVQFTDERVSQLMEARSSQTRGPFKNDEDFLGYLQSIGIRDDWYRDDKGQPLVLLLYGPEYNFRIRSTGRSGKVQRDITAIVYDFDRVKARMRDLAEEQRRQQLRQAGIDPDQQGQQGQGQQGQGQQGQQGQPQEKKKTKIVVPNERPNIVYWNET
jgi:general secretion pathway protein K